MKETARCVAILGAIKDCRAPCLFHFVLCLALFGTSTAVDAQQSIVERCVAGGVVKTEQCNCTDYFGRSATRECRQLVSDQTGSPTGRNGVCGVVCSQCECYGGSSSGGGGIYPQTNRPPADPNVIKFCVGEFEGDCPSDTKWQPCPQDSHEGAPAIGDRLCRAKGKSGASTSQFSVRDGHKCGYTVFTAVCN